MKKWAVLCVFLASPAFAETSLDLERQCKLVDRLTDRTDNIGPTETLDAALCLGFIDGMNEAMAAWNAMANGNAPYCLPPNGIPMDQARRLILKHLRENPKLLNTRKGIAVAAALHEAFPCPTK